MTYNCIKPRMGGTQYYLNRERKQKDLVELTNIILEECGNNRSVFSTLCWIEQKGMLNDKSVTSYLKYVKGECK